MSRFNTLTGTLRQPMLGGCLDSSDLDPSQSLIEESMGMGECALFSTSHLGVTGPASTLLNWLITTWEDSSVAFSCGGGSGWLPTHFAAPEQAISLDAQYWISTTFALLKDVVGVFCSNLSGVSGGTERYF